MIGRRSVAACRGWDTRRERDEAVARDLPAELLPLWERVRGAIKGPTPHARAEAFLQYAASHESESVEAMQLAADRKLEALWGPSASPRRVATG